MYIIDKLKKFLKGCWRIFSVISFIGEINMEDNGLLEELMELSVKKEIPYTANQLKRMKEERLQEVMQKYKERELDKMNEELVDVFFLRLEETMKRLSLIKKDSTLNDKLKDRKLLRKDVKNLISTVTPFLPYVGILEGALVTAGEVIEKVREDNKNESSSSSPEKRSEQDSTVTEEPPGEE